MPVVFSSLLFVFLFLVLNLGVYYFAPEKYHNRVLLIFSLVFYAWGGPRYLLLLLGDTAICWFTALQIEKARDDKQRRKIWMITACVLMLGILGVFKYLTFFLSNFQAIFKVPKEIPEIVLPIGISFYTFQLLSYVVDVYRGEVAAQPSYPKLLLYSSLFHQCIAGPIVRYETVANEIDSRRVTRSDVYYGIRRFSIGLAKKAILANSCGSIADELLPAGVDALAAQSTLGFWLGMAAYTMHVYLDFSAYSDMAIGLGRMVGFHYLENFNYPLTATSIKDFWRRWHISLSTFFRDYVYIPLGGNRAGEKKYVRNMLIVWFLTGLWHGANWNFIFWGLFFFGFLMLEHYVIRDRIPPVLNHLYAVVVVILSFVLFRSEDLREAGTIYLGMFGLKGTGFTSLQVHTAFMGNLYFLIFAVICCTPLLKALRRLLFEGGKRSGIVLKIYNVLEAVTPAILVILSALSLIGNSYNPFLYFQF